MTEREGLKAWATKLPQILTARENIEPPNEPRSIYEGKLIVSDCGKRVELAGVLRQSWTPSVAVTFHGKAPGSHVLELESVGEVELELPEIGHRFPAHLLELRGGAGECFAAGRVNRFVRIGVDKPVRHVDFQLTNFHDYSGEPVRTGTKKLPGYSRSRITFAAHGWRLTLDQAPSYHRSKQRANTDGGYASGHAGRFWRVNNQPITAAAARNFLSMLHYFFAFLRGCWCGPVVPVAHDGQQEIWRDWGPWRLTAAGNHVGSWFPGSSPGETSSLLRSFRRRWRESSWNQAVHTAIDWYVHANAEARTIEAGIVAAFVALELLAWFQMVEETGKHSATKFRNLSGAKRLSLLLQDRGVPATIPSHYAHLKRAARHRSWWDGPAAITSVRNNIVHPTRVKRQKHRRMGRMAKVETRELARTYVELVLLSLLDYNGKYVRRLFAGSEGDEIKRVPWA